MKFCAFLLAIVALAPVGAWAQGVIPTNNPTIFSQQPVQATGSTTPRTLATRAADVMHAADWGVVCDGSTDNSSAISNMMANEPTTGATIIFPPGTCVDSGYIQISISGTVVEGAAGSNSTILSRPAPPGQPLIYLDDTGSLTNVTVKNLTLQETGTTSTSDFAILAEGQYNNFSGLTITGFGRAIVNNASITTYSNNSISVPPTSSAIGILEQNIGGQNIFFNNTITSVHSTSENSIGFSIISGSADEFIFNEVESLNVAMSVQPATGSAVYSAILISNEFDHANTSALTLNGTAGSIQRMTISDNWFSSTYSGSGLFIEGDVEGLHISTSEFYLNAYDGITISAGSNVESFLLENSMLGGNSGNGITVGNNVSNFSLIGNVMGPSAGFTGNAYPYYITGPTNNNIIISGNNTIGNTNGPFNGSTGTGITIIGNNDTLGNQLQGGLTVNGIALATTPNVATLGTNPPVSGTAYQWTGPGTLQLACPVTYSPTSTAAATSTLDIGSTSTPSSAVDTESEPAAITAGMVHTAHAEVPAGWYYELSATNATIGTCVGVVH